MKPRQANYPNVVSIVGLRNPSSLSNSHRGQLGPLDTQGESVERAQISRLGIVTCDRLQQFKRCLRTYLGHLQHHDRHCETVVMDDSESIGTRSACRAWLSSIKEEFTGEIFYAGCEEKSEYIKHLSKVGIPTEVLEFALTKKAVRHRCPGANRNALLLQTQGSLFLSCDDDSVCSLIDLRRNQQKTQLVLFGNTALDAHFYSNNRDAVDAFRDASHDVLTVHERILGRTLAELAPTWDRKTFDHIGMGLDVANDLKERSGRVTVTLSGIVGDPGMPSLLGFMFATGDIRIRFLRDWEQHAHLSIVRGVSCAVVSPHVGVMTTTATGFDNRSLLPPFVPVGGGEDTLYGVLARKCLPSFYAGFVPCALLHIRKKRTFCPRLGMSFRLADSIMALLWRIGDPHEGDASERLRAVGTSFAEYARESTGEIRSCLLQYARQCRLHWIDQSEQSLVKFDGKPIYWAREIRSWIQQLRTDLTRADIGIPEEFKNGGSEEECYAEVAKFLRKFGQLLQWWPDIASVARKLSSQGLGVAKRI